MCTELFFIFPENKTASQLTNYFFEDASGLTDEEIKNELNKLLNIRKTFRFEEYVCYYDLKNVEAFIYPHMVSGKYFRDSYFNRKYLLTTILAHMQNWRNHSCQEPDDMFELFGISLGGCTLCEVVKRIVLEPNKAYVIVNCNAINSNQSDYEVAFINNDNCYYRHPSICYWDIKALHQWFSDHRVPQRTYNWNKKHGEYGKGEQKGESKLLGSRKEAEDLLKYAVGEIYRGVLFFYDATYKHYMEFKHEVNNQYHSFHIEDVGRIPHEVKKLIDSLIS